MTVSKRLRYEILRRDNHACRYCGATAPTSKLTVDHVVPRALGGADESSNLVTACTSCNFGKAASAPDSPIVDDIAADALRWANAMRRAAELQQDDRNRHEDFSHDFLMVWDRWRLGSDPDWRVPLGAHWEVTMDRFLDAGLTYDDVTYAVPIAMAANVDPDSRWRYFCGICWRILEQRRDIASSLIHTEEAPADGS